MMTRTAVQDQIFDVGRMQREASDPSRCVWVRASAGSGKTKVLSDRIIRLLLDGAAPQKILCLTFTRAAAAEMAVRLMDRLSRWATCGDAELEADLDAMQGHAPKAGQSARARRLFAEVLASPGGMRIQTIHAFAQELLGRFPLEAAIAPQAKVLDEAEAQVLRREALMETLEAVVTGDDAKAKASLALLAVAAGEQGVPERLRALDLTDEKWSRALNREGSVEGLIAAQARTLGFAEGEDEAALLAAACREGAFDREGLVAAARLMADEGAASTQARAHALAAWLAGDEETRCRSFDAYAALFLTDKEEPRKDIANKKLKESYPSLARVLDLEAARIGGVCERRAMRAMFEEGAALARLGVRVAEAYARRKAVRGALDYDDLIARARALLERPGIAPWVLFKLDGGIDHILLDEAQDTSPAQWAIIRALTEEFFAGHGARAAVSRTLFVVGDEKQSIYSFQKADPAEFERQRRFYADRGVATVELNVSFRSAPAVLRAVDAVFADPSVRQGVSEGPIVHRAHRAQAPGRVEMWDLVRREEKGKEKVKEAREWSLPLGYEGEHDGAAVLATEIVRRVKGWIGEGRTVYDRKAAARRRIEPGDILVLVQRRKGRFVEHLVRSFKDAGIPVAGADRMVLAEQLGVMDLVALLRFVLLPDDDLNLACVLRGPLIGASEDDLMALAIGRGEGVTLWRRLQESSVHGLWQSYLTALLSCADKMTPMCFLQHVLVQGCPADSQSGRRAMMARLGPQAEDPVDELLALAETFGAKEGAVLQSFVAWLDKGENEVKRELEQAEGRVRITTVHGAKGLESPIVILPDTVRVPEMARLPVILWDEGQGRTGLPFYVPSSPRGPFLKALRAAAREAQMEESRRLLYVAMTRAADFLVVCGFEPGKVESFQESWHAIVRRGLLSLQEPSLASLPEEGVSILAALEDWGATDGSAVVDSLPERVEETPLPPWFFAPPLPEPSPGRPLVPSRSAEEKEPAFPSPRDPRFARGRLMHKLLELLPDLSPAARVEVARRFLSHPLYALSSSQQEIMAREVLDLLAEEAFAPLFGPASQAEVPLVGKIGDQVVAGQVDRLALVGDEVWIVDYKTNRPPPDEVPFVYRAQMEAYRAVLESVYPGKKARCFLLWTYVARLVEVESGER